MSMIYRVKVIANTSKEIVEKKSEDKFLISVKEKAEQGSANMRVKELLAKELGVEMKRVFLVRGKTRPNKIFEIKE